MKIPDLDGLIQEQERLDAASLYFSDMFGKQLVCLGWVLCPKLVAGKLQGGWYQYKLHSCDKNYDFLYMSLRRPDGENT